MDFRNEYLEKVLGWKVTPPHHSWLSDPAADESIPAPGPVEVTHKVLVGVYAPQLFEPGAQVLLKKMLASIGLGEVPVVSEFNEFDRYIHVFWFDDGGSEEPAHGPATSARIWKFAGLKNYLSGDERAITARKKRAWNLLQQFRREAF